MDVDGRRVRARTGDANAGHGGAQPNSCVSNELLALLKGVRTNAEQFREHENVMLYLSQEEVISNATLVDTCTALLDEWSSKYTDRKLVACDCGTTHEVAMTTFEWAMGCDHPGKRFDLWRRMHSDVVEDALSVVPKLLVSVAKNVKYVLLSLLMEVRRRGLLGDAADDDAEQGDALQEASFFRAAEVITSCYKVCMEELRIHVNLPGDGANGGDPLMLYNAVGLEQRMSRQHAVMCVDLDTDKKLTSFQALHARLLDILRQRGYRKWNGLLYEPVRVQQTGAWTGAWKLAYDYPRKSNFETFFTEHVSPQLDYDLYITATASFRNRKEVIEWLTQEEEPQCPTLVFNRLYFSFNNAIVHTCGAVFPLDCPEQWQDIADRKNAEWATFARACARRLEAVGVRVDPFDLASRTMRETGEDMCIRPPCFDEATIKFIDEYVDESLFDLRFDGSNYAPAPADPLADVDPADPWDSPIFAYLDEIDTADFDHVQKTQRFDRATRFWDLATMGRGFFPGKTLDEDHRFPFHQGRAGTGKSLKLQVLQSYFPDERLGVLASRKGEETFWGMGMQHKWALFWLEVQSKEAPIDRGTFQQMVGYELVSLPQKNNEAVMKEWDAPIFAAGNEYFGYEDSAGSLRRRTLTFLYKVKPVQRDTDKFNKMKRARAPLLMKMLHSYHLQLMLFPGMDWQRMVPSAVDGARKPIIGRQLLDFHRQAIEALDPLQGFVSQEPRRFDFGPELVMSEAKFVEDYNNYRKERLGKPRAKWTEDHWQIVFEAHDIQRDTAEMQDPTTGAYKRTAVLVGLAPREAE